jgi:acyl-CoA synthetase (AMP-forming)/AMP-acid ligase II
MTLMDAVEEHGVDASSIEHWSVGGAGVPPSLIERAEALGWCAARSYGSTEHPTVTAGHDSDPLGKRASTDGRVLRGTEVRIVDEIGQDLPPGTAGEIVIRGSELMLGYRREDLNESAFLPGAWFRTGDIGVVDVDGFLTVTDRLKDVVIRGGENISSREVEDLLLKHHSDVLEVAVVGVPDERYGERLCACVKLRPGASLSLDVVRESFRAAGVAIQKAPERIEVVEDFPRTPAGKVKKFELRAEMGVRGSLTKAPREAPAAAPAE